MHDSKISFLLDETLEGVEGVYEDGGKTEFFKSRIPNLKKGDIVVVDSGTRHGFTIIKVTRVNVEPSFDDTNTARWIVCRIDVAAYDDMIAREADAIQAVKESERRKKREELRKQMNIDASDAATLIEPPSGK